ncbi:MAG: O-antigen ligase family protein [Chloroflexota bacterium]|nr:MAG: hypothetical protein DIU68_07845 [Chloroflexota bacterium]
MSSRPVMPARVEHPIPLRTALHHVVIAGTEQSLLPWIAAAGIGTLLGLALTWLPAIVVVSAVIGVGALLLVLKRPEFGILAILFFTSTIVPEESIPVVEAGPVQLYISDLILALLFGIILLRWLVERSSFRLIRTPLDGLMLGFFGIAVLATFWGIQRATTDISAAIPPLRIVTYYLLFFAVTNLIRSQRQLDTLIRGVFLLANLVAVTMILQFALGPDVPILPGRVEILNTGDARYNDITRITDFNGESPILLGLVCATAVWTRLSPKQRGLVAWFQWCLLGIGVVLTFNRNFWIGIALAVGLVTLLVDAHGRQSLAKLALSILLVGIVLVSSTAILPETPVARLTTASIQRLLSIVDSRSFAADSQQSTFRWRDFEYNYTLPHIVANPVTGIGFGAQYRPLVFGIDSPRFDGRTYTHNAHIWIMMSSGVFGYFSFMALSLLFIFRGLRGWRKLADRRQQGIVLGTALTYIGVIIGSIVNPMFMQWHWAPMIGLMMAINEVCFRVLPSNTPVQVQPAYGTP